MQTCRATVLPSLRSSRQERGSSRMCILLGHYSTGPLTCCVSFLFLPSSTSKVYQVSFQRARARKLWRSVGTYALIHRGSCGVPALPLLLYCVASVSCPWVIACFTVFSSAHCITMPGEVQPKETSFGVCISYVKGVVSRLSRGVGRKIGRYADPDF